MCAATYVNEKSCRTSATASTDGGDERRGEAAVQRVARGRSEPPLVAPRRDAAGDERIDGQAEGDDERRAAEIGHQLGRCADVYFDGHLVTMSVPWRRPRAYVPLTTTLRPTRNSGGGGRRGRRRRRALCCDPAVDKLEPQPGCAVRVAAEVADDRRRRPRACPTCPGSGSASASASNCRRRPCRAGRRRARPRPRGRRRAARDCALAQPKVSASGVDGSSVCLRAGHGSRGRRRASRARPR